ncbi:DUF7224 domain-containing protein [Streptomyces parvus]|uniref:DUF7224 domain-containing protein n=1 Tax=Streptomyces parvus TaxID=66428 RepID=UPI003625D6B4
MKVSPFLLGISLFYYFGDASPPSQNYGHAPTIVSFPLFYLCSFAYAAASALAAWEAGTITKTGVWDWSPTRSKYRVAAEALLPTVCVAWAMLVVPVTLGLVTTATFPTLVSLGPLFMAMALCVAHTVIGFAIGLRLPRPVAAPVLAVVTWIVVAFTISLDPPWLRQLSGLCFEYLMFGEALTFSALWPPVLLLGGLAAALASLWSGKRVVTVPVALALVVVGTLVSFDEVKDRGYFPPIATGVTEMTCARKPGEPEICMPRVTSSALPGIQQAAASVLAGFREAGVERNPRLITDTLPYGRFVPPSTQQVWRVPLTRSAASGNERMQLVVHAVGFTCAAPEPVLRRAVLEWAAHATDTTQAWQKLKARYDRSGSEAGDAATAMVRAVQEKPKREQAAWFERSVRTACRG